MKATEQKERRRTPRTILGHAAIAIYPKNIYNPETLRVKICDISLLGTRFISFKPFSRGSEIVLSLLSPENIPLPNISGRVVRCEQKETEYHAALEFVNLDDYQKSLVENYIRTAELWNKKA
jgi:c-di-GMP-binding flagellar brake protein YcgR